jgi:hypothetical protein
LLTKGSIARGLGLDIEGEEAGAAQPESLKNGKPRPKARLLAGTEGPAPAMGEPQSPQIAEAIFSLEQLLSRLQTPIP